MSKIGDIRGRPFTRKLSQQLQEQEQNWPQDTEMETKTAAEIDMDNTKNIILWIVSTLLHYRQALSNDCFDNVDLDERLISQLSIKHPKNKQLLEWLNKTVYPIIIQQTIEEMDLHLFRENISEHYRISFKFQTVKEKCSQLMLISFISELEESLLAKPKLTGLQPDIETGIKLRYRNRSRFSTKKHFVEIGSCQLKSCLIKVSKEVESSQMTPSKKRSNVANNTIMQQPIKKSKREARKVNKSSQISSKTLNRRKSPAPTRSIQTIPVEIKIPPYDRDMQEFAEYVVNNNCPKKADLLEVFYNRTVVEGLKFLKAAGLVRLKGNRLKLSSDAPSLLPRLAEIEQNLSQQVSQSQVEIDEEDEIQDEDSIPIPEKVASSQIVPSINGIPARELDKRPTAESSISIPRTKLAVLQPESADELDELTQAHFEFRTTPTTNNPLSPQPSLIFTTPSSPAASSIIPMTIEDVRSMRNRTPSPVFSTISSILSSVNMSTRSFAPASELRWGKDAALTELRARPATELLAELRKINDSTPLSLSQLSG